jgi:hypothetical protein
MLGQHPVITHGWLSRCLLVLLTLAGLGLGQLHPCSGHTPAERMPAVAATDAALPGSTGPAAIERQQPQSGSPDRAAQDCHLVTSATAAAAPATLAVASPAKTLVRVAVQAAAGSVPRTTGLRLSLTQIGISRT